MDIETRIINLTSRMLQIRKESILDQFESILEKEEAVAYSVGGEPLNRKEYKKAILDAKKSISKGKYITQENLKKEFKNA